jgi:hypothetical protein
MCSNGLQQCRPFLSVAEEGCFRSGLCEGASARQPFHRALAAAFGGTNGREPAAASLAAGSTGKPPPQRQFAGCDRGTWPLRVTRRQLLYRRSSAGGDAQCSAAQIQAAPAPARHGKIRPAGTLVCAPPGPPCRAVLHRSAALALTMLHPFCCVMVITVTCVGTDAALPCLEPLFEKPPWMKISNRTSQAVHNGCWPTDCGNDTQDAARHWQATPARPTRHLPRPGHPSTSSSCRRIRHPRSDARRVRANDSPHFFRRPTAPRAIRGTTPLRRCLVATCNG